MMEACQEDELLAVAAAGELIDTEIEIRSGRGEDFAHAAAMQAEHRERLFALADRHGPGARVVGHAPVGELPRPADHRHRALQPPARRAPVGRAPQQHLVEPRPRGGRRRRIARSPSAITCASWCRRCSRCRPTRRSWTATTPGLHSIRTQIFTRTFPRCGIHEPFRRLGHVRRLHRAACTRPARSSSRRSSGGACGLTTGSGRSSSGSATRRPTATSRSSSPALIGACIAQSALDFDEGKLPEPLPGPRDRGEPLARDPLGPRRRDDRLARLRRDGPDARVGRAPGRVERARGGRDERPGRAARTETERGARSTRSRTAQRSATSTATPSRRRAAPTPRS